MHGINASPEEMGPLVDASVRADARTLVMAYDDNYRRLGDTANDMRVLLNATLSTLPEGQPLEIEAHSMGSRVALVALSRMADAGELEGKDIRVTLVAPPLNGFVAANGAWLGALVPGLADVVPNIRPGQDMATLSPFQSELDSVRLPSNVQVHVVLGANDTVVPPDAALLERIAQLGATVEVLPGDHVTVLDARVQQRDPGVVVDVGGGP